MGGKIQFFTTSSHVSRSETPLHLIKSNLLSLLQVPIDSMLSSAQSPGSEKSCNSVELAADKVFRRRDPKNGSGMTSYLSSSFNCVFAQAT